VTIAIKLAIGLWVWFAMVGGAFIPLPWTLRDEAGNTVHVRDLCEVVPQLACTK
jgi:hypothetical protein